MSAAARPPTGGHPTEAADGAVRVRREDDGALAVTGPGYRLTVAADGVTASLAAADDDAFPLHLELAGALDRVGAVDETLSAAPPRVA